MIRPLLRLALASLLLAGGLSLVTAQDQDFRSLLRAPETPLEFWQSARFELDVGRPDLAATYLRGLLNSKPAAKDWLAIADKDGITEVLKIRNIPEWSRVKKEDAQARKDVEEVISQVLQAVRTRREDPARIRELIAQLKATREERLYAIGELVRIGAGAVPYLLDAYRLATAAQDRLVILQAIRQMGAAALDPLLAALDTKDELLKLDLLDILSKQYAASGKVIVPHLWYLSAAKSEPESVRKRATSMLATFLNTDPSRLPPAKVALTREAERYYNHQVPFGDKTAVAVWRWDNDRLVQGWPGSPTVTESAAEEYFGLRFARQALLLDPGYRPAQIVFLSLAVDKAMKKGGLAAPLVKSSPAVAELLARASSETVIEMLERAMKEKQTTVALAAVQSLSDRAEIRARRPLTQGEPVFLQALYYPDLRVQLAAVEGLLRLPGDVPANTSARIVDILARALSPASAYIPGRKILVAGSDETWQESVRQSVLQAGFQPVVVNNTREAMRQVRDSGEIEAVLLDTSLIGSSLANTLAQLRQDVDVAKVPILLTTTADTPAARQVIARSRQVQERMATLRDETRLLRQGLERIDLLEKQELEKAEQELLRLKTPTPQIAEQLEPIRKRYNEDRQKLRNRYPAAVQYVQEYAQLQQRLEALAARLDIEGRIREAALERHLQRVKYDNVQVVHVSLLTEGQVLSGALQSVIGQAGVALSAEEQKSAAERAIVLLARLAEGDPPGFDIRPASEAILKTLRMGRLSPEGQQAAIRATMRLQGPAPQTALIAYLLDDKNSVDLRITAARALIVNFQRQGPLVGRGDIESLRNLAAQPKLDPRLKAQVDNVLGSLQSSERDSGQRIREYNPVQAGPAPPAKAKKAEKEEEKEDKDDK